MFEAMSESMRIERLAIRRLEEPHLLELVFEPSRRHHQRQTAGAKTVHRDRGQPLSMWSPISDI